MRLALMACLAYCVVVVVDHAPAALQDDQVAALVKQLKDKDEFVRLKAAKVLGTLGAAAKDAVPALTDALKDADADVREVAKQALAKVNAAVDAAMRAEALAVLEKNLKAAKDEDAMVRRKAAVGLAALLADPDDIIRLKAVQALGEMGGDAEPAAVALKEAAKDTDEAVRKGARRALEKLDAALGEAKTAKAREALAPLLKELKAPAPEARIRALEKVAAFGPDAKIVGDALVEAMLDRVPAVRNAATEALEKVEPAIQPHVFQLLYGENKYEAAGKLKAMGAEARHALPALAYVHQAAQGGVQLQLSVFALEAMTEIGPREKPVIQAVLRAVVAWKGKLRVEALARLNAVEATPKEKATALLAALQEEVRAGGGWAVPVIESLEKLGQDGAPAIPLLKQLKFAQDDQVRNAAVKALAKIE